MINIKLSMARYLEYNYMYYHDIEIESKLQQINDNIISIFNVYGTFMLRHPINRGSFTYHAFYCDESELYD